ncbi:MAG: hypothetical protein ACYC2T_13165 [Bacillota bacterium]
MSINKICILHRDDLRYADMTITPAHLERIRQEFPGVSLVVVDNKRELHGKGTGRERFNHLGHVQPGGILPPGQGTAVGPFDERRCG